MNTLGETIRTARSIYAFLHGEEKVWNQISVMTWMNTARKLTREMRTGTFDVTLRELNKIPVNLLEQLKIYGSR